MKNIILMVGDWVCCRVADLLIRITATVSRLFHENVIRKTVFVYANDLLGDTMVKLPFFFSLRREFPKEKYRIVLVLNRGVASMVEKLNCADEIIEERPLHWRHSIFWIFTPSGILAKSLRWAMRHKVDVVIVCHRSRSLGSDFAVCICKPSVGVAYAVDMATPMLPMSARYQMSTYDVFYTHLLEAKRGRHQLEEMDMLLSMAAGHIVKSSRLTLDDVSPMLDYSVANTLPGDYIVLVPGARVQYRRWPTNRFAEVTRRVGGAVVIVGTQEEFAVAEEIAKDLDAEVVNLSGKTTLPQLGGVLQNARFVLANETGAANFAAAIGARTICVLGGGDFGAFFPNDFYKNTRSIYHSEPCFGCRWTCPRANLQSAIAPCIDAITVDEVYSAAKEMLDGHGK